MKRWAQLGNGEMARFVDAVDNKTRLMMLQFGGAAFNEQDVNGSSDTDIERSVNK